MDRGHRSAVGMSPVQSQRQYLTFACSLLSATANPDIDGRSESTDSESEVGGFTWETRGDGYTALISSTLCAKTTRSLPDRYYAVYLNATSTHPFHHSPLWSSHLHSRCSGEESSDGSGQVPARAHYREGELGPDVVRPRDAPSRGR